VKPELGEKIVKFAEIAGKFSEQTMPLLAQLDGQLQKCASTAPALVERCIKLNLVPAIDKAAAEKLFADPIQLPDLINSILTKFAEERAERVKLAAVSLGQGEGDGESFETAGTSPFVGAVRGQKSAADTKFREAILNNR
jgi:hypothetical protein